MMAPSKTTGRVLQMVQKTSNKQPATADPHFAQALQSYETGLRAMQEHKFDKAKSFLQRVVTGTNKELADRALVHLNTCNQHMERDALQFSTPEEHYDYAVSLMNLGDYVGARENLEKLSGKAPKADYVAYGMAALNCLTGHPSEAMHHLAEAIRINPALRFQARNDSDFHNLSDDPRFTELLYPEPGDSPYSSSRE